MPQIKSEGCLERRFIRGGQVRSGSGEKAGIEGYASVFNEQYDSGYFVETIKPGAFARALTEKQDVRCLFNHNPDNLLGRTKSNTLRMSEDSTGLHFECDTNPETRVATDVQSMIGRGDIDGCSFGFSVCAQSWREEKDADGNFTIYREIEDVDLYDVGPVTYPAFEGTSVAARSLWPLGVPEEVRSHVPALRTDAPAIKSAVKPAEQRDSEECDCPCGSCEGGNCADCDCDGCDSEECDNESCNCGEGERKLRMSMRLRLAEHA